MTEAICILIAWTFPSRPLHLPSKTVSKPRSNNGTAMHAGSAMYESLSCMPKSRAMLNSQESCTQASNAQLTATMQAYTMQGVCRVKMVKGGSVLVRAKRTACHQQANAGHCCMPARVTALLLARLLQGGKTIHSLAPSPQQGATTAANAFILWNSLHGCAACVVPSILQRSNASRCH